MQMRENLKLLLLLDKVQISFSLHINELLIPSSSAPIFMQIRVMLFAQLEHFNFFIWKHLDQDLKTNSNSIPCKLKQSKTQIKLLQKFKIEAADSVNMFDCDLC